MTAGPPRSGLTERGYEHEASHDPREDLTVCVGFPGKVVSVDELGASVDQEGRVRRASTLLIPEIAPGDWVFVAAGTIVERIDPDEAEQIRATLLEAIALEEAEGRSSAVNGGTA